MTDDANVELGSGYATPEEAAVASFPEAAGAHVIRLEYSYNPSIAYVIVDTEPSHLMRVNCLRRGDLWYEVGDIVE